jgi:hypothetical protein
VREKDSVSADVRSDVEYDVAPPHERQVNALVPVYPFAKTLHEEVQTWIGCETVVEDILEKWKLSLKRSKPLLLRRGHRSGASRSRQHGKPCAPFFNAEYLQPADDPVREQSKRNERDYNRPAYLACPDCQPE